MKKEKEEIATTENIKNVSKLEGDSALKTVDVKDKTADKDAEKEPESKKEKTHKANIKFVGKNGAKPQAVLTVGRGQYLHTGADAKEQREGFYHEDAAEIIEMFPELYEKA